jgi:hypothetical protein
MDKTVERYFLYCMNMQCQNSIYHDMTAIQIPLSEENLLSKHCCAHCDQPLVSAIDLEINQVLAHLNVTKPELKNYNLN